MGGIQGEQGEQGISPHIDETTGNWFIGEEDTNVKARGDKGEKGDDGKSAYQSYLDTTTDNPKLSEEDWLVSLKGEKGDEGEAGTNGITPHVGDNGNWFIGDIDTEVKAQGPQGEKGADGTMTFE